MIETRELAGREAQGTKQSLLRLIRNMLPHGLSVVLVLLSIWVPDAGAKDLAGVAGELARTKGGVVDTTDRHKSADLAPLHEEVARWSTCGGSLWIVLLPDGEDLKQAIKVVGGRLAPLEHDAVIVASGQGAYARVPGLGNDHSAVQEAFEGARREMAANLPRGVASFGGRLARALDQRSSRGWRFGILGMAVGLILVSVMIARWRAFHLRKSRWDREDLDAHSKLVGTCQDLLAKLSSVGPKDPSELFEEGYADLETLRRQPPAEARPGLMRLAELLEKALTRQAPAGDPSVGNRENRP